MITKLQSVATERLDIEEGVGGHVDIPGRGK